MAVSELLIPGVDAADFSILSSDSVSLPTLERLMQGGVSVSLKSTTPSITGAAWPAMACGSDPNSIGMFDFRNFSRKDCRKYRPSPSALNQFVGVVPPNAHGIARTDLYESGIRPASPPETGFKDFQQTLIEDRSEHGEMDEVKKKLAELGYSE
ncbi:alkaline phosphatase family protein [Haloarcula sp. H-GB5]